MVDGDFYSQGPKLASRGHADPKREYKSPSIMLLNLIIFSKTRKSFFYCQPLKFSYYLNIARTFSLLISTLGSNLSESIYV